MADKKENTSTDLGNERYSATDAETAAFDLNPYLVELMWSEPFYARNLRGITKKRTEQLPTAGDYIPLQPTICCLPREGRRR